jgi:hypothetical protein
LDWNGPLCAEILSRFPAARGSYGLYLRLPEAFRLTITRLGTFEFSAGNTVYLGSAHEVSFWLTFLQK